MHINRWELRPIVFLLIVCLVGVNSSWPVLVDALGALALARGLRRDGLLEFQQDGDLARQVRAPLPHSFLIHAPPKYPNTFQVQA